MTITTKVIKYKQAFHMFKMKLIEYNGKQYNVKLIKAIIPGQTTSDLIAFTHGDTLYLIPEYIDIVKTYYTAYKIAKIKQFERDLTKIKISNPKKLLKKATIIDKTNNIILASIQGITIIIKDKSIYLDKLKEDKFKLILTNLNK